MNEPPKRPWLIAALSDDDTDTDKIERDLHRDVMNLLNHPEVEPKPLEPNIVFIWIHIYDIEPRFSGHKDGLDKKVALSVVTHITNKLGDSLVNPPLALLLDRSLLIRNHLDDAIQPIISHPFFNPVREPARFVCCYGDTPSNGMRCTEVSETVCPFAGCTACNRKDASASCRHTCYWQLIGMLLEGRSVHRQGSQRVNESVKRLIPPVYIY